MNWTLHGSSAPSGSASGTVVLNYFPQSFGDFAGIPTEVEWVHSGHGDSVHALRLQVHDFNGTGCYTLHFDFDEQALPDQLRRRSLQHVKALLDAMLENPDRDIAGIDIRADAERQALEALNASNRNPLPDRTVIDLVRERAQREPAEIALQQGKAQRTYAQLWEETGVLAACLVQRGVEPGDRIAIYGRRSIQVVLAMIATLRARAAYVPIDPAHPAARIATILEDASVRIMLLGDESTPDAGPQNLDCLTIDQCIRDGRGLDLDSAGPELGDLAYMLYTSGSTGRPKGVLIEHGGLIDYLQWAARQYVRGDRLCFPLFTSLSFDLTVTSLYLPLITGGRLEIYPEPEGPVDSALMDVIEANSVDFIKLTPSHLTLLKQVGLSDSRLRCIVVGGEDFKTQLATEISAQCKDDIEIYNEYGPTEAVVGCILHRFSPIENVGHSVPIGRPADHVKIEILNDAKIPVPEGVPGELWVSRFGLARGYHGREEFSAECFQPHPDHPGERRYRTGDRVRLTDGRLEYLGRLDRQLKISGYRIEPGEIEAALVSLPRVEQCAVVGRTAGKAPTASEDDARYCVRCGLPSNYPQIEFDQDGVCNVCHSYEAIRDNAQAYFKTMDDLRAIFAHAARTHACPYDCMMLLSGGKDSTYALCQLVEMGLSVFAFTLDNGFISEDAKVNIRRVTEKLGVPVEFGTTPAMNAIFRDSLERFSNVCNGCFKTIYTLSTLRALELGIPIIVTGLSRGQMFETCLTEEMFRGGLCSPEEVDAAVFAARKIYHRIDDEVFRSMDVSVFQDDRVFEQIQFVDFYRYCDVRLGEVYAYLQDKIPWVRPRDTGRSTNCLINDIGIYVHKKERGFHNYALPYSWDVRLGHKTREAAHQELHDRIDLVHVRKTLEAVGYNGEHLLTDSDQTILSAYYVATSDLSEQEIRSQLAERLPTKLIPTHFYAVESIPLNRHGKVDESALPSTDQHRHSESRYRSPEGPVEEYLSDTWRQVIGIDRVGADDHFFELGGTSLGAMQVMIRLCREFDIDLPLETLFTHPRLTDLARLAEDRILYDVAEYDASD